MATGGANEDLKRELICPICLDYFREPVMLNCGHNFCQVCICMHWDESGDHFEGYDCPQCRAVFNKASFTKNFLAQNLVDKLDVLQCLGSSPAPHKPVKVDGKCEKHGEELKLYCHTDKRPICVVCRESRVHRHHRVAPVSEIINDMKGELESRLAALRWHKTQCVKVRTADERNKSDARQRKRRLREKIEADVGVLVQFLLDERDSLLESLDADERAAVAAMDDNLEIVEAELAAVEKDIADINAHLTGKTNFEKLTKTYNDAVRAKALMIPVPAESATGWSDFPEPFQLVIWKKMMHVLHTMPQNLTMDPDTAHPNLCITDFDTKVEEGHIRLNDLPDLPERFNRFGGVLATAHYSGGQHYWEVDVKDKGVWYLGVTSEYSNRKGFVSLSPSTGYWSLCLQDRLYANEEDGRVPVADYWNSPRVGVYLDYDNGRVSFYDAVTMKKLYVFDTCFDEPVYPFFSPGKNDPGSRLQICHYY